VHVLLTSFFAVFLAEMGDKTQLLVFALAARYRKPWPVMAGVLAELNPADEAMSRRALRKNILKHELPN